MSQPAHPPQKARVIIRHCDSYDPERIRQIVREGLEELDLRPFGRTLMKPNLVASGPLFENAHTRVEFAEGVMKALAHWLELQGHTPKSPSTARGV